MRCISPSLDEELQTLLVPSAENVLFQSVAQGLANGGTATLSRSFDAGVTEYTVTVGIEMLVQVSATHTTL